MPHLVIVRRGQAGAYEVLKTEFERDAHSGVRVMWDRRQGERRETGETENERRHRTRRGAVSRWPFFTSSRTSTAAGARPCRGSSPTSSGSTGLRSASPRPWATSPMIC
jgi:hypothetical protein